MQSLLAISGSRPDRYRGSGWDPRAKLPGAEIAERDNRPVELRQGFDKGAVERRDRVDHGIGAFSVTLEARRCVSRNHVGQNAAAFRALAGKCHVR